MRLELNAVFQKVPEGYIGWVEEVPGAFSQGDTLEEVRSHLEEAVLLVLETNRMLAQQDASGKPLVRERLLIERREAA